MRATTSYLIIWGHQLKTLPLFSLLSYFTMHCPAIWVLRHGSFVPVIYIHPSHVSLWVPVQFLSLSLSVLTLSVCLVSSPCLLLVRGATEEDSWCCCCGPALQASKAYWARIFGGTFLYLLHRKVTYLSSPIVGLLFTQHSLFLSLWWFFSDNPPWCSLSPRCLCYSVTLQSPLTSSSTVLKQHCEEGRS